jgi:DNA-binding GntR family transcriptional regulator
VVATIGAQDIQHLFAMRILLEGEAAALAAARIDRSTLDELLDAAEGLHHGRPDARWQRRWASHDAAFHDAIARATGNPLLTEDITRYHRLHRGLNRYRADARALQRAAAEHLAIVHALKDRDPERARQAMTMHLVEWRAYFSNRVLLVEDA